MGLHAAQWLNYAHDDSPWIGFSTIDVRDLVDLHIRAMESAEAAGQRFIGTGDFLWLSNIAHIRRERFGVHAAKVPTRALPDVVVRLLACPSRYGGNHRCCRKSYP